MALRNVLQSGNENLKKISKEVKVFDESLHQLLDDMYETMQSLYGAGIAAPQVGVLKRAIVLEVNNIKLELINPVILNSKGSFCDIEGCLSVKGIQGYVKRPMTVTVKANDRFGNEFTFTGSGNMAQCICHEIDHLNGILFTDIMTEQYIPNKNKKKGS